MTNTILTLDSLSIAFSPKKAVVKDVNLELKQGECLSIVGQSGSGKTLTALSIPQLLPKTAMISQKSKIIFGGCDLLQETNRAMDKLRGFRIGMIFQDAMAAFNPVKTIGQQISEMRYLHAKQSKKQRFLDCLDSLKKVGLKDPERVYNSYPHQLSGGMKQRAMIALALSHNPQLLIADEPTTALDVTVQKQVLELINSLRIEFGFSILFISHDLSVVSQVADHVAVMKNGVCLESSTAADFFSHPKTDYAIELRKAVLPLKSEPKEEITTGDILTVEDVSVSFKQARQGLRRPDPLLVLKQVYLSVRQGETVALIGESGSGKTTLAKTLVKLVHESGGKITLHNNKDCVQMVFQDPYSSFNPRRQVGDSILEVIRQTDKKISAKEAIDKMCDLLRKVSINPNRCWDYPHEFSGGEKQRISIARALASNAQLLLLDEPTSALDVSSQLEVLDLLANLQKETGISYLLITHHMGIVAKLAHRVAVMKDGHIVEQGETHTVLSEPKHSYTRELLSAVLEVREC
jgi:ABC-type microcin C transport system duplicated ATPase subunit YejF